MTTVGAAQGQPLVILDHKSLKTVFTENVKALEQSGIFVGVETDSTGELLLQLFEDLLGYVMFSHLTVNGGISGCISGIYKKKLGVIVLLRVGDTLPCNPDNFLPLSLLHIEFKFKVDLLLFISPCTQFACRKSSYSICFWFSDTHVSM